MDRHERFKEILKPRSQLILQVNFDVIKMGKRLIRSIICFCAGLTWSSSVFNSETGTRSKRLKRLR